MRYIFLFLLLAIPLAKAEDYRWEVSSSGVVGVGPTPEAAYLNYCNKNPGWVSFGICKPAQYNLTKLSNTRWRVTNYAPNGILNEQLSVDLFGERCSNGGILNTETGACDAPPDQCLETKGNTNYNISHAGLRADFPPGSPVAPINTRMCDDSCAYQYAGDGSTTNCGTLRDADPAQYYCVFKYTGIGEACLPGDEPINANAPPNPDPPVDPNDPTDPRNNCGRGYAWSGTTCVRYWDPDNPTDPSNPDPGNGGNNGGGSTGGGNNGGGNTGGGDTGGTDPGSGNGGGGGGGNNGGDGDGDGDGAPTEKLEQGEQGSFDEALKEWDEKIADIQVELDQKIAEYTGLFSGVFDLNLGGSGGSLPCYNVPIKIGAASTSGKLCIADYERELSFLRYILLLVAAVVAAFIVLRD